MSSIRKTYNVQWNNGDPVTVSTNAWDLTAAADVAQTNVVLGMWKMLHHALERNGYEVPPFKQFVDELDSADEVKAEPEPGTELLGEDEVPPTQEVPGDGVLLR